MVPTQCHRILFQLRNKLPYIVEFDNIHRGFTLLITYTQDLVSFGHCIMIFLRTSLDSSINIYSCELAQTRLRFAFLRVGCITPRGQSINICQLIDK